MMKALNRAQEIECNIDLRLIARQNCKTVKPKKRATLKATLKIHSKHPMGEYK